MINLDAIKKFFTMNHRVETLEQKFKEEIDKKDEEIESLRERANRLEIQSSKNETNDTNLKERLNDLKTTVDSIIGRADG